MVHQCLKKIIQLKRRSKFLIKIVSPKIEINKFFQNYDSYELIEELIKLSSPNKFENSIFIFPEGTFASVYLDDLHQYNQLFSNNFSDEP